ncbi:GDSL-type esterase/lipase family protein [Thalassoglobus sp. JC818]|uniref:GDSL-type esterase/lipase family protein n=1 Tax=Thalassoglobus sp. JC818 TaxID=3232136 RepID=UPI00345B37B7
MNRLSVCLFTLGFIIPLSIVSADEPKLEKGDLVVSIGNTLIEREQEYGDWELELTRRLSGQNIRFRNLGWSGDTVWAESRGIFDPPKVGYERLIELAKELKPNVIVFGYGGVESEGGIDALPAFIKQYEQLVNDVANSEIECLHLLPIPLEESSFPVQNSEAKNFIQQANQNIQLYADAIRKFAESRGEAVIDLTAALNHRPADQQWRDNGLHLNATGYQKTASAFVDAFGLEDQEPVGDAEELRALIRRKNELFFHRWRPQNITYLTGFRKHEQGQNAVEIAQFDPLIAEVESQISSIID